MGELVRMSLPSVKTLFRWFLSALTFTSQGLLQDPEAQITEISAACFLGLTPHVKVEMTE